MLGEIIGAAGLLARFGTAWQERRRKVRVTVHRAFPINVSGVSAASVSTGAGLATSGEAYYVSVTNLSPKRAIEITHVWFDMDPPAHVLNDARPLPHRLDPDHSWETWAAVSAIPAGAERAEYLARVRLTNRQVLRSRPAEDLPPVGYVPG